MVAREMIISFNEKTKRINTLWGSYTVAEFTTWLTQRLGSVSPSKKSLYKLNLNYKASGKISHRPENFHTLFKRLLKAAWQTGMKLSTYEEKDGFAHITFEKR